jgi:hypothetical protein
MNIQFALSFLILCLGSSLYGQNQAAESVVSAAGQNGGNAQFSVNGTLGEAVIFSATAGGVYAGQGFQTLNAGVVSSVVSLPEREWSVKLYPNPSQGWLYLETDADIPEFRIFSANGHFAGVRRTNRDGLDLSGLPAGAYSLQAQIDGQYYPVGMIIKVD